MAAVLVTAEDLARALGVSGPAVAQAKKSGRLTVIKTDDGDRFDLAVARIQWEANRKRARATSPGAKGAPTKADVDLPDGGGDGAGGDYWDAKTRRERAEASMAELKERALRGELVRKAVVERELAAALVTLRETLEVLADRISALMAAESDPAICRLMLRDEHRKALATFTERAAQAEAAAAQEAGDGVA